MSVPELDSRSYIRAWSFSSDEAPASCETMGPLASDTPAVDSWTTMFM
jgi:hypothetical protein